MKTYHSDVIRCFIWKFQKTSYKRTNGTSCIRTTETTWWRTTETPLGVSFETCLRRREDALMRRRCYVILRRRHDVLIGCRVYVPLRRLDKVRWRHRWVFFLRRTCDITETYRETSLRRGYDVLLLGVICRFHLKHFL